MNDTSAVHVAILIVSYRGQPYLCDCLDSIHAASTDTCKLHAVVVDNASPDQTSQLIQAQYPDAHLVQSSTNLGFAGGNNLGWQYIQQHLPQAQYVMLLNQDARLGDQGITPLIDFLQSHPNAACVQPAIMLHDNQTLLNS